MIVDIISSVLNGVEFLPDLVKSLQAQTHAEWRLWVRDDGSADETADMVDRYATEDDRIHLLSRGGPRLGIVGSFGKALEAVPADAAYVMCADVDDVWLPRKIECTLDGMQRAERELPPGTPVLAHTDLVVVDRDLRVLHPSLWKFSGIEPEPASLRRLAVVNVATAPTVMLNRALREAVGTTPQGASYQDWWYTLVAAALGRVVAVPEATVLYRQHGANAGGARKDPNAGLGELPRELARRVRRSGVVQFRRDLRIATLQAQALLDRYGDALNDDDREFMQRFARIPKRAFLGRKLDLLRYRVLPEHGILQTIGIVLRG